MLELMILLFLLIIFAAFLLCITRKKLESNQITIIESIIQIREEIASLQNKLKSVDYSVRTLHKRE